MSEALQHVKDTIKARPATNKSCMEWHVQNIPCTKRAGESCRLLEHRRGLNQILLDACLEIRENRRGKTRGDAIIAVVEASTCGHLLYGEGEDLRRWKPLELVKRLLAEHRCITAIEFIASWKRRRSLLSAVKHHSSVKSVAVCGRFIADDGAAFMCEVIESFPHLESLAFKAHYFEKEWGLKKNYFGTSLYLGWHHLTTLDVAELSMSVSAACSLIHILIENKTITDLRVGQSVFGHRGKASSVLFDSYLAKEDSALRKLTLQSSLYCDEYSRLRELIDAFCKMNTLEELNADIVVIPRQFVDAVSLFAEVVSRSATLRSLRLPSTYCDCVATTLRPPVQLPDPKAAQCMQPWLAALRRPNLPLRKLCIDLRGFGEAECHAFFDAVAETDALESVVVLSLPGIERPDRVCATIKERGLSDRVVIKWPCMRNTTWLQQCPQIGSVTIRVDHDWWENGDFALQRAISALEVLGGCSHVTSLRVHLDRFDPGVISALAACIRAPSALTDVNIDLTYARTDLTKEERDVQEELVRALASNLKLVRVKVNGVLLSDDDFKWLAHGASKSLSLTEFAMAPGCFMNAYYVKACEVVTICPMHGAEHSTGVSVEKNIALADILETTRRNASAVLAAAQFVLGQEDGLEGASSIELMHSHPRLLEMVSEGADVTKAEAKEMISSALLRVRLLSLDEFMRMTGVVQETAEFLADPGARRQLSDLNLDCWLHVRRFLKIADVLQPRTDLCEKCGQSPPAEESFQACS